MAYAFFFHKSNPKISTGSLMKENIFLIFSRNNGLDCTKIRSKDAACFVI